MSFKQPMFKYIGNTHFQIKDFLKICLAENSTFLFLDNRKNPHWHHHTNGDFLTLRLMRNLDFKNMILFNPQIRILRFKGMRFKCIADNLPDKTFGRLHPPISAGYRCNRFEVHQRYEIHRWQSI